MKKILITGGGGLIGQAIARRHIEANDEVYIWDNKSNIYNDYTNLVGTDISNTPIDLAIKDIKPEVISHQASKVSVGESQYKMSLYSKENIQFTSELLNILLTLNSEYKPEKILQAGSMGIYGEGTRYCLEHGVFYVKNIRTTLTIPCPACGSLSMPKPNNEETPCYPQSFYAVTKLAQENSMRIYANIHKVDTISLRYFSVYGDNCNPQNPFTGVLSVVANKMLNAEEVEFYEDGWQTRDLVHVDDVAEAHFKSTRYEKAIPNNFIALNVATSFSMALNDVFVKMRYYLGCDKPTRCNNKVRLGDVRDSCADISKIWQVLGWWPTITIDNGIRRYCKFIDENREKFTIKDTNSEADKVLNQYGIFRKATR